MPEFPTPESSMPDSAGWRGELRQLIWAAQLGEIDEPQTARLEELICSSKEARREYLQYASLVADLQCDIDSPLQGEAPPNASQSAAAALALPLLGPPSPSLLAFFATRLGVAVLITAIATNVLAVVLMVVYLVPRFGADTNDAPPVAVQESRPLARLMAARGAAWLGADRRYGPGDALSSGDHELMAGSIDLQFGHGAAVSLIAPCKFAVRSRDEVRLDRGRLMAAVPHEAIGFTVTSPHTKVVDLGTEFGVEVDDQGDTEVQVFVGKVELQQAPADGQPADAILVRAGEARRVTRGDSPNLPTVEAIPLNAAAYEGLVTPAARAEMLAQAWRTHREHLAADPRVVAYYDFPQRGDKLVNLRPGGLDGLIHSAGKPSWTTGRWRETGGLAFGDRFAHVVVPDAAALKLDGPLSVLVSVRVDAVPLRPALVVGKSLPDGKRNYAIWVTLEGGKPQFSWSVYGRDDTHSYLHGRTNIEIGSWYTVLGVASKEGLALYVNGQDDGQHPEVHLPLLTSNDNLQIGISNEPAFPEPLTAVIDELAIFRERVSAEEAKKMVDQFKSP